MQKSRWSYCALLLGIFLISANAIGEEYQPLEDLEADQISIEVHTYSDQPKVEFHRLGNLNLNNVRRETIKTAGDTKLAATNAFYEAALQEQIAGCPTGESAEYSKSDYKLYKTRAKFRHIETGEIRTQRGFIAKGSISVYCTGNGTQMN